MEELGVFLNDSVAAGTEGLIVKTLVRLSSSTDPFIST